MFFRVILEAVVMVLAITLLRAILGTIMKGFSDLMRGSGSASADAPRNNAQRPPTAGELKKDPVCGTFIATSTSVKKTADGVTYYFCSPECRDKFRISEVRKAG